MDKYFFEAEIGDSTRCKNATYQIIFARVECDSNCTFAIVFNETENTCIHSFIVKHC